MTASALQVRAMAGTGVRMQELSSGEVGGMFAGVVAGVAALGKGLAWLLDWHGERQKSRSARLDAWEQSLVRREVEYREAIETELEGLRTEVGSLRKQQGALSFSLLEVTIELRTHVPASPSLVRAASALRAAFPVEAGLPPEISDLVRALDGAADHPSER